jgi:hypothetical protein
MSCHTPELIEAEIGEIENGYFYFLCSQALWTREGGLFIAVKMRK